MNKEEVIEGNKLIAEFMEYRFKNQSKYWCIYPLDDNSFLRNLGWVEFNNLKFHLSWDWLMPCIGKISNVCEEPEELDGLKYALLTNNIEEAWKFVVNYLTIS